MTREKVLLVDRALGRHVFPQRVVACGYRCLTLADFYGDEQAAQAAADTAWLADAASHELVILTRDENLYVNEHERLALERYSHRVSSDRPEEGHRSGLGRHVRGPPPCQRAIHTESLDRSSSRSNEVGFSARGREPEAATPRRANGPCSRFL